MKTVSISVSNWAEGWGYGGKNVIATLSFDGETFKYRGHRQGRHGNKWDRRWFHWHADGPIPDVHLLKQAAKAVVTLKRMHKEAVIAEREAAERRAERERQKAAKAAADKAQHKLF